MPQSLLKEVLNSGRFSTINNQIGFLIEPDKNASLNDLKIEGLSTDALLLNCDSIDTQTIFKKGNGQNMRCDYLLIDNDSLYFIEMKTSSKADEKYFEDCKKNLKLLVV